MGFDAVEVGAAGQVRRIPLDLVRTGGMDAVSRVQAEEKPWTVHEKEAPAPAPESQEVYRTALGREVYGGGGISPDITVEPQSLSPEMQYLLSRSAFFDYAIEYTSSSPVEDRDWQPPADLLGRFAEWLLEKELTSADESEEMMADEANREAMRRYLHAEIFNSAFGIEARYEVLAAGDPQIERALELLGEASDLLARKRGLREAPEVAPTTAIGG